MRRIDLKTCRPAPGQEALVARLTRHLEARLLDFAPGGPEVLSADQARGVIRARFPGHDTEEVLDSLAAQGILAELEGDSAVFTLSADVPFEALDRVWGCLNVLL